MNPLLSKLHNLMHAYQPIDFNTKYNENVEFLTDQDQEAKHETPVKNLNSFQELDHAINNLNEELDDKAYQDRHEVCDYIVENFCAFIATLADFTESNIEDFLKSTYVQ